MIASGGNRNPAKADLGAGRRAERRRIGPSCPSLSSVNATVPCFDQTRLRSCLSSLSQQRSCFACSSRRYGSGASGKAAGALGTCRCLPGSTDRRKGKGTGWPPGATGVDSSTGGQPGTGSPPVAMPAHVGDTSATRRDGRWSGQRPWVPPRRPAWAGIVRSAFPGLFAVPAGML
jgi:hypothetical protein